jgi:hypothetical protein
MATLARRMSGTFSSELSGSWSAPGMPIIEPLDIYAEATRGAWRTAPHPRSCRLPVSYWDESRHPLRGPLLKLARAKEHFSELRERAEAFLATEPYEWSMEAEEFTDGTREYRISASVDDYPPIELGVLAGDVVQNLRAALDQLIWAYSARDKRNRRTAFPICLTAEEYRKSSPSKIQGVPEEGREFIETWQPFQLGDGAVAHPLAKLQQLSNTDKHRTLLPVAVVQKRAPVLVGYGEWKVEDYHYFNPTATQLLEGTEVMTFLTSGEPPDKWAIDPFLSWHVSSRAARSGTSKR